MASFEAGIEIFLCRLSCCINAFIFCVHHLCFIGRVHVFYVGYVDKSSLYETLFHCNILSKHHHYHIFYVYIIEQGELKRQYLRLRLSFRLVMRIYLYMCIWIYIHICIYTCIYIFICIHI
jgi:hypothetical protein